jgi:hypothetical protein
MKKIIAAGIASGMFLIAGCSGSHGTGGPLGPADTTSFSNPGGSTSQKSASTALFNLATGQLPYPIDLYFAGKLDGTLNIPAAASLWSASDPALFAAVNALDGFSTTGVIRESFAGALNPASINAASVILVQVAIDNSTRATVGVTRPLVFGTDFTAAVASDVGSGGTILEITPLHPLVASTGLTDNGYLVFLTNAITDASGNPAVPDTDYAAIKAALPTCNAITDPNLNGVCKLTGAHLQIAAALAAAEHIDPVKFVASIVLSFSFSTQSIGDVMAKVEGQAAAQSIQVNCPTALAAKSPLGHADLCLGVTTIPYYLSRMAPLTGNWNGPGATELTRFNSTPAATENLPIPVLVAVPNASTPAGALGQPAAGWPVAIVQHGLNGNREQSLAMADSLAAAGFVVLGIDFPLHGITDTSDSFYASFKNLLYTGLGLPTNRASIERTFDLDAGTNGPCGVAEGSPPDGKTDPSGSHFLNVDSPLTLRDNFREGAADLITVAHSLQANGINNVTPVPLGPNPAIPLGLIKIDPTRVHYVGLSLGAIIGTVFLGSTPNIADAQTGTLGAPGGGLSRIPVESVEIGACILPVLQAKGLSPGTTLFANFARDIQNVVDSGDPTNFIAAALANHPTQIMEMIGGGTVSGAATPSDQVVPNVATQRMITAAGFGGPDGTPGGPGLTQLFSSPAPQITPGAAGWRIFTQFICGGHGSLYDPSINAATTGEMQQEAVSFAAGSAGGNVVEIGFPIPPAGFGDPLVVAPQPAGTACP